MEERFDGEETQGEREYRFSNAEWCVKLRNICLLKTRVTCVISPAAGIR